MFLSGIDKKWKLCTLHVISLVCYDIEIRKKKDVYKNLVCYLATNVAISYVINEIYKKRSELKVRNCSYCDPGLLMFHGKKWGK